MRVCAITAVLHAVLTTGSPVDDMILSALAPQIPTTHAPSPRSTQDTVQPTPAAILAQVHDSLELRHALGFARVAAPPPEVVPPAAPATALPAPAKPPAAVPPAAAPPAVDPLVAPAAPAAGIAPANQAVPPAPPAAAPVPLLAATTTIPSPPLMAADDFVTVQWVETHIGTLRTWVPKTQTFHFEAMSQAPLPGAGGPIGMGTLTGKTGQTQTIVMVVAAAPTPTVDSRTAIAVAVAVGLVGLAV